MKETLDGIIIMDYPLFKGDSCNCGAWGFVKQVYHRTWNGKGVVSSALVKHTHTKPRQKKNKRS